MLFGQDRGERYALAHAQRRQLAAFVVGVVAFRRGLRLLVAAFFVHGEETRVDHGGAGGAKRVRLAGREIDGDGVERGVDHLAGHRALPDQLIQAQPVRIEERRDRLGGAQRRGRADRLVRFLRVLGLGLVLVRARRQGVLAEVARDQLAQFGHRFFRQMGRIGTHVGNQAHRALVAQGHALVQLLRDAHGAAGEAELACGFLLQGGSGERRCRTALALLALHVGDVQPAARGRQQSLARGFGVVAVGQVELFELLAVEGEQARHERLAGCASSRLHAPVLARLEGFDLFLALHDHAQRRRLHASGRESALHLAPQHRREVEADQVIERAPRLLRVDQIARPGADAHGFLDRARGDLGEHHAMQRLVLEQAALLQDLRDVPADRLAFAVRVGGQIQRVGALGRLADRIDMRSFLSITS
jgi:hypothetical protein